MIRLSMNCSRVKQRPALTLAVSLTTSPVTCCSASSGWKHQVDLRAPARRSGPLSVDGGTRADVWSHSVFLSAVNSLFRDEPAQCGSSLSLSSLHRRVCPPSITSFSSSLSLSVKLESLLRAVPPSIPPPSSSLLPRLCRLFPW